MTSTAAISPSRSLTRTVCLRPLDLNEISAVKFAPATLPSGVRSAINPIRSPPIGALRLANDPGRCGRQPQHDLEILNWWLSLAQTMRLADSLAVLRKRIPCPAANLLTTAIIARTARASRISRKYRKRAIRSRWANLRPYDQRSKDTAGQKISESWAGLRRSRCELSGGCPFGPDRGG